MNRAIMIRQLREAGIMSPEADTQWMLAENKPEKLDEWIERRLSREPLQYIIGTTEFYGYPLKVDRRVLIPRPETEQLVETVLKIVKRIAPGGQKNRMRLLDVGTGSGCIAIALAKKIPQTEIAATDISADALALARENAAANGVSTQIHFSCDDLFPRHDPIPFDLIISNPPYISSATIETLMPEVRDWEPRIALDGGRTGLKILRRMIAQAAGHLKPDGGLLLEIGEDQSQQVALLIDQTRAYQVMDIVSDWTGRPRIAIATRRHS